MDDCEPMDVDISSSSASKMDISDVDLSIVKQEPEDPQDIKPKDKTSIKTETEISSTEVSAISNVKKFHIKLEHQKKKSYAPYWTLFSTLVSIVAIITYHIIDYKCYEKLDLNLMRDKLTKNIVGQDKAVRDIIRALNYTKTNSKILVLYGGTGVGKTYTLSLMMEGMLSSSNFYHYTMPSFTEIFSPELLIGLTVCNHSIIVVDDLTISDKKIKSHIRDILYKNEDLNKNVTIILVFNCDNVDPDFKKKCHESFLDDLKTIFDDLDSRKFYIKFDRLEEQHLIQCIVRELETKYWFGRYIEDYQIEDLVKYFDVQLDGCKGVPMKINFLVNNDS